MDAQTVIAKRIAQELRPGMLVNLGIGIPTLVANFLPAGLNMHFQSENGLIGSGPMAEAGMEQPLLTDAGGRPITALPGASTFRQRDVLWSDPRRSRGHDRAWRAASRRRGPSCELDDPWKVGPGHGRGDGPRDRRQARDCGDAAHCQGETKDHEEMHAAADIGETR